MSEYELTRYAIHAALAAAKSATGMHSVLDGIDRKTLAESVLSDLGIDFDPSEHPMLYIGVDTGAGDVSVRATVLDGKLVSYEVIPKEPVGDGILEIDFKHKRVVRRDQDGRIE